MIRLIVEGLVKRYDRVAVVDGASLEVGPGELVAVLGPSGAGKSTLGRIVAGLESADGGEVYFDDRLMAEQPPHRRPVGLVTQEEALWPHLSLIENVGLGPWARGMSRRDRRRRAADAMALVGVEGLADRKPLGLSPSQRRRAELARAIVSDPALLIVDAPGDPVDNASAEEVREAVRRVQLEAGRSALVLTRDRDEAMALGDRLAVMDLGRIVQVGPPHRVYEAPADAFVAKLLGPTNLLQGQVAGTDARGDLVVRTTIGRLVGRMTSGAAGGSSPIGTPVTIAIRPEAIRLGPSLPPDANRFTVTVERQVFRGATRHLDLRGPGDWPLSATTLHGQAVDLREGQAMTVAVPPEQVVILQGRYATGGGG